MGDGFFQSPGGVTFLYNYLILLVCLVFALTQRLKSSPRNFVDCLGNFSLHAFHFVVDAVFEAVFLPFFTFQLFAIAALYGTCCLIIEPLVKVTLDFSLP